MIKYGRFPSTRVGAASFMPAFSEVLDDREIIAATAYQSSLANRVTGLSGDAQSRARGDAAAGRPDGMEISACLLQCGAASTSRRYGRRHDHRRGLGSAVGPAAAAPELLKPVACFER